MPTYRARTTTGLEVELSEETVGSLRSRLKGQVFSQGDSQFEASRTVWNGMISRSPAVVARCIGTVDVINCVRFAREHDLLLCIKGGGHNIAGLGVADGALMIDMSLMRGVWVDTENQIAHAQAGCVLGTVDRETQLHGLAAALGFVSLTGITGLTTGGGLGYLTRRFGWTSDTVVGMDVVTSEGQRVRASDRENPDLFWGLRGGGGNFGVVTGIDYRLYPVGPEILGGIVAWPASEAPGVLELYRTLTKQAPRELTLVALMRPAPPAPWLPPEYHGKPIVAILACYSGDPKEGEKLVAPIKSFGDPIGDILVRRPYTEIQSILDATQPTGRRYYWKSEYLAGVGEALCDTFAEHAAAITSPHSAVILFHLAGALNELPENHSPVGNRDAQFVLNIAGAWDDAADDGTNIEWARSAWNDMKSFSTGGTYVNFLTEDASEERIAVSLGSGLDRLREIKAKWDPDNFFRTNRNIKPA